MRLLCLTSRLPYPPNRGDRLRAFHFIEHLSQDHELTLVSFIAGEEERGNIRPLQQFCKEIRVVKKSAVRSAFATGLNLWRRQPLQSLYYRDRGMAQLVQQLLAETNFDAAYVHLFRMAPYLMGNPELFRIVDLTDVISQEVDKSLSYRPWFWRFVYGLERPRIEAFERAVAERFEESWLISEADRLVLQRHCPEANIRVVPNGVDLEMFRPLNVEPTNPNDIIFVGHMGVFHNIDAAVYLAREILPLVRQETPDCRLTIVGAEPAAEVRTLETDPAVTVTGFVPDLNSRLNQAAVFVAPLRFAAGVQNKVLEAMAAGLPVVTTKLVHGGIGAEPGKELFVSETPSKIAGQIVTLLQRPEIRETVGSAARNFVAQNFSWQFVVQRLRDIENTLKQ